jgi:hypothetical protein
MIFSLLHHIFFLDANSLTDCVIWLVNASLKPFPDTQAKQNLQDFHPRKVSWSWAIPESTAPMSFGRGETCWVGCGGQYERTHKLWALGRDLKS